MEFLEKLNIANRELRKTFKKSVKVVGRGHCCRSCTLAEIEEEHFIVWTIFNSGMNENVSSYKNGDCNYAYACWDLTDEQLNIAVEILSKYFKIEKPKDDSKAIKIELV